MGVDITIVYDVWMKFLLLGRCAKMITIYQMDKLYFGRLWIWKRCMMLLISMVCGRC